MTTTCQIRKHSQKIVSEGKNKKRQQQQTATTPTTSSEGNNAALYMHTFTYVKPN